jgi:hypothetical protein
MFRFETAIGRGTGGVDRKTCRPGAAGMRVQFSQNRVRAADRLDVPAQRQHVAPMAVGMKQGFEQAAAGRCERAFELRQPVIRFYRDVIGSVQHSRSHTSRLRGGSDRKTYAVGDYTERPAAALQ